MQEPEEWWMPRDPEAAAEIADQLSPGAIVAPLGTFGVRIRPRTESDRLVCRSWESAGLERVTPDVRGGLGPR
jgi:hypothetical protein